MYMEKISICEKWARGIVSGKLYRVTIVYARGRVSGKLYRVTIVYARGRVSGKVSGNDDVD